MSILLDTMNELIDTFLAWFHATVEKHARTPYVQRKEFDIRDGDRKELRDDE